MSCNRENAIWESKDGTWSRGFFVADVVGEDSEWDVDYDFSQFEWVSTGHADWQAAYAAWDGANPGMHTRYSYADAPDQCQTYDEMAADYAAYRARSGSGSFYASW